MAANATRKHTHVNHHSMLPAEWTASPTRCPDNRRRPSFRVCIFVCRTIDGPVSTARRALTSERAGQQVNRSDRSCGVRQTGVPCHQEIAVAFVVGVDRTVERGPAAVARNWAAGAVGAEAGVAASKTRDGTHHRTAPVHVVAENRIVDDVGQGLSASVGAMAAKPALKLRASMAIDRAKVCPDSLSTHCSAQS